MSIYITFLISLFLILLTNTALSNNNKMIPNKSILSSQYKIYNKKINIKHALFNIFVFIIFLFSALRFGIGWDYWAYYDTIKLGISTNITSNGELLTIMLIDISKLIKVPQLFFIINAAICIGLISNVVRRYSRDPWMSMIIFVTFPLFYLNSFSVIRNFSAIAIAFYANKYILEKKLLHYVVAILVASQFHTSALIALVFYPLKHFKIKNSRLIFLVVMAPLISKLMRSLVIKFTPQYSVYLNKTTLQEGTKAIFVFLLVAIAMILLMKYFRGKNNYEIIMLHYNNFTIGLLIYLMFFETGTMGHRLSLYGTISSIILIPEIVGVIKESKIRMLAKIILYIFLIIFFLYIIHVGRVTYIPYKTFFNR